MCIDVILIFLVKIVSFKKNNKNDRKERAYTYLRKSISIVTLI